MVLNERNVIRLKSRENRKLDIRGEKKKKTLPGNF